MDGTKRCRHCGKEIPRGAGVCPECGRKTKPLALRLWWLWLVGAVLALSALGSAQAEAALWLL